MACTAVLDLRLRVVDVDFLLVGGGDFIAPALITSSVLFSHGRSIRLR